MTITPEEAKKLGLKQQDVIFLNELDKLNAEITRQVSEIDKKYTKDELVSRQSSLETLKTKIKAFKKDNDNEARIQNLLKSFRDKPDPANEDLIKRIYQLDGSIEAINMKLVELKTDFSQKFSSSTIFGGKHLVIPGMEKTKGTAIYEKAKDAIIQDRNDLVIIKDIITLGEDAYIAKLKAEIKTNKNVEKNTAVLKRIESGVLKQTKSDLITDIQLANSESELELIELEIRKQKIALLGPGNCLSEKVFIDLQTSKKLLRLIKASEGLGAKVGEQIGKVSGTAAELLPQGIQTLSPEQIKKLESRIKDLEESDKEMTRDYIVALRKTNLDKGNIIHSQNDILDALQTKVEQTKQRMVFKDTVYQYLDLTATAFTVLGIIAKGLKFVPVLNIIAPSIETSLEGAATLIKNTAYQLDKSVSKELRTVMKEHVSAIKKFMWGEFSANFSASILLGVG